MDMTGWLEYFVEGLATQMREVQDRGERAIKRDVLVQKHRLSKRQGVALNLALEQGGFTIKDLERLCPKVTRRTLQRDLKGLLEKDLLKAHGATNRLSYSPGPAVS